MKRIVKFFILFLISLHSVFASVVITDATASLSGIVWYDANLNGIKEKNEGGILGVRVHLYKDDLDTGLVKTTDEQGRYTFYNLEANHKYKIKVDKPKNYPYFTIYNVDNNTKDDIDSDINPYSGFSDEVFLSSNQEYTTLFAGLVCKMCKKIDLEKSTNGEDADLGNGPVVLVGDKITWEYTITNIGNVELKNIVLTDDKEGTISCPSTTLVPGASMSCKKEGVAKLGKYENMATVTATTPDETTVSDKDPSHYLAKSQKACLGNYYWYDANLNGIQDSNEVGIKNMKVELYDANKNLLRSSVTNENGEYYFCDLDAGNYYVKFILPETYLFTLKDQDSNDIKDSDANENGWSDLIELEAGEENFRVDVGIYCSCEDYKVHPEKYDDLKFATPIETAVILFILLLLITITFRKDVRKNH